MKTIHNTKNCNYRRFLHTKLKHGKISGRFYKFICRSHPYHVTTRNIELIVREILDGKMTEDKGMRLLQQDTNELKRQKEMYQSNIEYAKKVKT
jgi:hypothetical protein